VTDATEEGLVRAVLAAPDDDAPRLAYADWCDEHDRGTRGPFIRAQIRHEALRADCGCGACVTRHRGGGQHHNGPCVMSKRQAGGGKPREVEFALADGAPWLVAGANLSDYRRGFLDRLTASVRDWAKLAPAVHWRPGFTDPCDGCHNEYVPYCPYTPGCDDGRFPRPCPVTAQPIRSVEFTHVPVLFSRPYNASAFGTRYYMVGCGAADSTSFHAIPHCGYEPTTTFQVLRGGMATAGAEWPGLIFSVAAVPNVNNPVYQTVYDLTPGTTAYAQTVPSLLVETPRRHYLWLRGGGAALPDRLCSSALRVTRTTAGVDVSLSDLAHYDRYNPPRGRVSVDVIRAVRHRAKMLPVRVIP
jgi:uncharacterized protein (TIGR02996 family)